MSDDYLFDKTGDDAEVTALETALGDFAHRAPMRPLATAPVLPMRRARTKWLGAAAIAGGLAAAAAVALVVLGPPAVTKPVTPAPAPVAGGFEFQMTTGVAHYGDKVQSAGTLAVGAWLETPREAMGSVTIANIGELTVYGDSKLRIVDTSEREHRLELVRGRISARVTAPPRLFVVDTPVATATDLGCAYDLSVADDGATHLRVTSGAVELAGAHGASVYVLGGHEVDGVRGRAVGTPVAIDVTSEYRASVARFDGGDGTVLPAVLAASGPREVMSLWNLIPRTTGADRAAVVAALEAILPLPDPATRARVLALDPAALDAWRSVAAQFWIAVPFY